jgi:surface antigen
MQSKSHMPHISLDATDGSNGKLEMTTYPALTFSLPTQPRRSTEGQQRRNGKMSTLIRTLKNTTIASIGAVALLAAGASGASADHKRHGWHGKHGKKIVVIHKNNRKAHRNSRRNTRRVKVVHHHYRQKPVKVVHHYYKPKPVKVVHHHYKPRRNHRPANIQYSNQTGGLIIGALLGAATGSQFGKGKGRVAAVLTGTVIGAVIGGQIGNSMDRTDHVQVQNAMETVPTGRSVNWKNPDNGKTYTVTPTRTYRTAQNGDCRDYDAWVFIDGYERKVTGAACRKADGTWQQVQG